MAMHIRPHPASLLCKPLASFQLLLGLFPPQPCASDEHTHEGPPRRPSLPRHNYTAANEAATHVTHRAAPGACDPRPCPSQCRSLRVRCWGARGRLPLRLYHQGWEIGTLLYVGRRCPVPGRDHARSRAALHRLLLLRLPHRQRRPRVGRQVHPLYWRRLVPDDFVVITLLTFVVLREPAVGGGRGRRSTRGAADAEGGRRCRRGRARAERGRRARL